MSKYKIGITEAGDAGIDFSWVDKINLVDGAILITKCISNNFCNIVLPHKNKVIIHATLTGYGGTVLEPNVPIPHDEFNSIMSLVSGGFPRNHIVIRVDPIIPTKKGISVAEDIIRLCIDYGFNRFRISVIDMYPHVRKRFMDANLPLPYGDKFYPSNDDLINVNNMLKSIKIYHECKKQTDCQLRIESCAEPGLTEALATGCVSEYDMNIIGLDTSDIDSNSIGYQRKNCLCYSGKVELLEHKIQCPHECLYCYWRNKYETMG